MAVFYDGKISVLYSNGFFAGADPCVNYWLVVAYSGAIISNMAFLPVPFLYRYMRVCRGTVPGLLPKLMIIPICVSLMSFVTAWIFMRNDERFQWTAVRVVERISGAPLNASWAAPRMFGLYNDVTDISIYPYVALTTAVTISVYVCIFWSERQVMRKFRIMRKSMRSSTKQLHADIHNALVALAICPTISMMIPATIFLLGFIFRVNMGLVSIFLVIVLTSVTLLNPITTCYFVRPFRRFILKTLSCNATPYALRVTSISAAVEGTFGRRCASNGTL